MNRRVVLHLIIVALCLGLLAIPVRAVAAGDYIVVLKDGFSTIQAARRHGAVPTFVYQDALRGYAATLSDAALARAEADQQVAFVEEDRTFETALIKNWAPGPIPDDPDSFPESVSNTRKF